MLTWLIQSSLAATLLVGLVLVLRRPVRRRLGAEAALALWLAPALALVLPPTGLGLWVRSADAPADAARPIAVPITAPIAAPPPPAPLAAPRAAVPRVQPAAVLLGLWTLGAGGSVLIAVLRNRAWRRTLLAEGRPATGALAREAASVFAERGVTPALIISAAAATPQVTGLRRPLIAVPPDFETRFDATERRLALAHEAAHVAGRDLWLLTAAELAAAVHWFNPALRLALAPLRADMEAACDARVLRGGARASAYADTLLRAARGPAAPLFGTSVPALTLTHALHGRIDAMRHPVSNTTRLLGTAGVLALAGLAAATAQVQDGQEREVIIERSTVTTGPNPEEVTHRFEHETSPGGGTVWRFGEGGRSYKVGGPDADLVLLSDPFSDLVPPAPALPEGDAPEPPAPPPAPRFGERKEVRTMIVRVDGETRTATIEGDGPFSIQADEVEVERNRDGRTMIIRGADPATIARLTRRLDDEDVAALIDGDLPEDAEIEIRTVQLGEMESFEADMEAFGEEMGRFGERMGAFGERMGAYGADMGAWGERMGAVGGAVADLAAACDAHKAETDAPTILTQPIGDDTIKAVCASGGGARYQSGELTRFVRRNTALTRAEKRAFLRNRDADSTVTVNR